MLVIWFLVVVAASAGAHAGKLSDSSWRGADRDLAPGSLLARLDRLVNVCVANYEDLTTDLLLGIAIANAQLRYILQRPLQEADRQFVASLAKKCDFVESRIESIFSFPSGANAVVSKLLINSEFWRVDEDYRADGVSSEGVLDVVHWKRRRRRRSQPALGDPKVMMKTYLQAIDVGGPSEQQSDECLSELLVSESENEYNASSSSENFKNSSSPGGPPRKRLIMSRECSAAMSLRKRSYGYHLTHKLLFYIVLGRQGFANVGRRFVVDAQRRLCEAILRESELIAGFDFPELFRDLFMEQMFLCAYSQAALPEFADPAWLATTVGWQNGEGCFKFYGDDGDGVEGPNALTTHCSTHMTGVGAALMALFAKLQLQ
ncbi:uncharacterized protein LOC131207909 [Anopheles bellator]|uniref:uncharacterized protein LOC131207909 n=1 Tax=Anopheles bellator TaxID=139047 RepID=UPI002649FD34|nr:uncharacterized protein LOC131207909 [Anopheles bellator]